MKRPARAMYKISHFTGKSVPALDHMQPNPHEKNCALPARPCRMSIQIGCYHRTGARSAVSSTVYHVHLECSHYYTSEGKTRHGLLRTRDASMMNLLIEWAALRASNLSEIGIVLGHQPIFCRTHGEVPWNSRRLHGTLLPLCSRLPTAVTS